MQDFEYMNIKFSLVPDVIISHYNLSTIAVNGYVMVGIRHGMYGLSQSVILGK